MSDTQQNRVRKCLMFFMVLFHLQGAGGHPAFGYIRGNLYRSFDMIPARTGLNARCRLATT